MRPSSLDEFDDAFEPRPSWASFWHVWTLIIPRRAIDASLVWGRVWRRHDGRRWIYKRLDNFEPH
jgi:hypothetical protein